MTVCFFIDSLDGSAGSERMTVLLANYLVSAGHSVHIICRQGGDKCFFVLSAEVKKHYLFKSKAINIYSTYFKALGRYNRIISQIKPDYIIDVCVAMSIVTLPLMLFKRNIKVISWEHFNANAYFNYYTAKLSKWLASKFAYSVIVLTEADKNTYQTKFKPRQITVIANPVTTTITKTADLNSKYVLAIGRLTHQKGFDILLDAWKIVSQYAPGWNLRIIGGGELEADLKEQCKALQVQDSVQFLSPTLAIEQYYVSSSVFVMSSRFEGLPLVLIEAKAYGLPIVSFDCETGPREIIRDGIDGVLVPPGQVDQLAASMLELINDKDKRVLFGINSQQNIGNYLPENFYAKWEQILNKL